MTPAERMEVTFEKATAVRVQQATAVSYLQNYKKIVTWCEEASPTPSNGLNGDLYYVTREFGDEYVIQVVPGRNGEPQTIARICYGLQWVLDNVECPNGPSFFRVKNDVTIRACKKQKEEWVVRLAEVHAGTDPHKGLRDLMSDEDQEKRCDNIYRHRNDWDLLITSWTLGTQAALRGDSNRKLGGTLTES
jgi:hypothetical protein